MGSYVITVYGRYDFAAANSLISPIALLMQKGAFVITASALSISGGDFSLPYFIFIGVGILGAVFLLCVTSKCKGKV